LAAAGTVVVVRERAARRAASVTVLARRECVVARCGARSAVEAGIGGTSIAIIAVAVHVTCGGRAGASAAQVGTGVACGAIRNRRVLAGIGDTVVDRALVRIVTVGGYRATAVDRTIDIVLGAFARTIAAA